MLTTAYSLLLKRVAVVDVLLLAALYTLRVLAGIAAAQVRFSTWLLAFSMFLFLSLAFLKRYTEVSAMEGAATEQVRRRGYLRGDREWLGSMGGASGYLSVLVLALYINSEQVVALYRPRSLLWLVCPLLLFWISRMWLLAHRGRIHDDPIVATVRDPVSYVLGALVAPRAVPRAVSSRRRHACTRHASLPLLGPLPAAPAARRAPVVWRSEPPALDGCRGPVLPYALGSELRRQLPQRRRRRCSTCAASTA